MKSNRIKKVFVRCLCKEDPEEAALFCPCVALETLRAADDECPLLGFTDEYSENLGTTKLHGMRIGDLFHTFRLQYPTHRVQGHLRWVGEDMVQYYNRGQVFFDCRFKDLKFLAM